MRPFSIISRDVCSLQGTGDCKQQINKSMEEMQDSPDKLPMETEMDSNALKSQSIILGGESLLGEILLS